MAVVDEFRELQSDCLLEVRGLKTYFEVALGWKIGATVRAVGIMAGTVGGRLGIKASGGIRTAADAIAMINAGATRLGLSSTAAVLGGLTADEGSY